MPIPKRVFADANVLVSRVVTVFLVSVCASTRIELCTSRAVIDEAIRALAAAHPNEPSEQHEAHLAQSLKSFRVDVGRPPEIVGFTGRDPGDEHVYRALVQSGADALVTFNRPRDFTRHRSKEPFEVLTPDEFLCLVTGDNVDALESEVESASWRMSVAPAELPQRLKAARCPRFANAAEEILGIGQRRTDGERAGHYPDGQSMSY